MFGPTKYGFETIRFFPRQGLALCVPGAESCSLLRRHIYYLLTSQCFCSARFSISIAWRRRWRLGDLGGLPGATGSAERQRIVSTIILWGPNIAARADQLGQVSAVERFAKNSVLDLETVRMEVEKQVGTGPDSEDDRNILTLRRVKKVLALAARKQKRAQSYYVGTEHILLGLLRERRMALPLVC